MNKSKTIINSEFFNNLTQTFEGLNKIGNALSVSNKLDNLFSNHQHFNFIHKSKKIGDVLSVSNKLDNLFSSHQYFKFIHKSMKFSYLGQILQPPEIFKKTCFSVLENLEDPLIKIRELAGNLENPLAISNPINNNIIDQQFFPYDNPIKTDIKPKFNDNINFVTREMIDKVSKYVVKYIPDFENRIELALENLNSKKSEKLSSATLILRRILADLAKKIEPANTSEKYYKILADYIKGEHRQVCEVHLNFIVDEANRGVHEPITQNQAIKLFFHFVLFLDEINWDDITKTYLN